MRIVMGIKPPGEGAVRWGHPICSFHFHEHSTPSDMREEEAMNNEISGTAERGPDRGRGPGHAATRGIARDRRLGGSASMREGGQPWPA